MNEKFTEIDTPDTYANRICSFVQGPQPVTSFSVPLQKQYVPPNPQNNKSQHYLELIAEYFGYPDDHPRKPENLFNFIETEFEKRVAEAYLVRKRSFAPKRNPIKPLLKVHLREMLNLFVIAQIVEKADIQRKRVVIKRRLLKV
ncbi:unnamed protein product [Rhizophagus irregularis]|nr:unnamed protein product [Rhizophagus irregularis]